MSFQYVFVRLHLLRFGIHDLREAAVACPKVIVLVPPVVHLAYEVRHLAAEALADAEAQVLVLRLDVLVLLFELLDLATETLSLPVDGGVVARAALERATQRLVVGLEGRDRLPQTMSLGLDGSQARPQSVVVGSPRPVGVLERTTPLAEAVPIIPPDSVVLAAAVRVTTVRMMMVVIGLGALDSHKLLPAVGECLEVVAPRHSSVVVGVVGVVNGSWGHLCDQVERGGARWYRSRRFQKKKERNGNVSQKRWAMSKIKVSNFCMSLVVVGNLLRFY